MRGNLHVRFGNEGNQVEVQFLPLSFISYKVTPATLLLSSTPALYDRVIQGRGARSRTSLLLLAKRSGNCSANPQLFFSAAFGEAEPVCCFLHPSFSFLLCCFLHPFAASFLAPQLFFSSNPRLLLLAPQLFFYAAF
jgi:hypothetical protein